MLVMLVPSCMFIMHTLISSYMFVMHTLIILFFRVNDAWWRL